MKYTNDRFLEGVVKRWIFFKIRVYVFKLFLVRAFFSFFTSINVFNFKVLL